MICCARTAVGVAGWVPIVPTIGDRRRFGRCVGHYSKPILLLVLGSMLPTRPIVSHAAVVVKLRVRLAKDRILRSGLRGRCGNKWLALIARRLRRRAIRPSQALRMRGGTAIGVRKMKLADRVRELEAENAHLKAEKAEREIVEMQIAGETFSLTRQQAAQLTPPAPQPSGPQPDVQPGRSVLVSVTEARALPWSAFSGESDFRGVWWPAGDA